MSCVGETTTRVAYFQPHSHFLSSLYLTFDLDSTKASSFSSLPLALLFDSNSPLSFDRPQLTIANNSHSPQTPIQQQPYNTPQHHQHVAYSLRSRGIRAPCLCRSHSASTGPNTMQLRYECVSGPLRRGSAAGCCLRRRSHC
jgi:hypothetical protein